MFNSSEWQLEIILKKKIPFFKGFYDAEYSLNPAISADFAHTQHS
jgi:hypothetical protein